jgi:23S rRNA (cytosine1962-C5)-methyltransferase
MMLTFNALFDNIPKPTQRIAIKVKPAAERQIRKGHPWVFENSITKQNKAGQAGDLAIIFDQKDNKFLAAGLFDPHSPIRIKLLQFNTPARIDADWFAHKIDHAFQLRQPLLQTDTNSYRFIHGENDGMPGFVADVYAHVLVIKLYALIWLPYLSDLLPPLLRLSGCQTVVLRLSRSLQRMSDELHGLGDGQIIHGELKEEEVVFKEHGLRFVANVIHGHKTGYFLDHRHNRRRVGAQSAGKKVLDVFAYAGGFSVHALAGGATSVTSLDISAQALAMAQKNVALNFEQTNRHHIMAMDAFEALEQLRREGRQFDIVVIDPPSFAKQDSERARALRSYARLAELGVQMVTPDGLLVLASCSSRVTADDFFETIERQLQASGRAIQPLERTFHDVDHPIGFPQGAYLKCGYFQVK